MIGSDDVIVFNEGESNYQKNIIDVYNSNIKMFLEGYMYDTFGDSNTRPNLKDFKFKNTSSSMIQSLQKTIEMLLLERFPEINIVKITTDVKDGVVFIEILWELLNQQTTTVTSV